VFLFSVILHEIAHASCAFSLGDPTAKLEGRITLNPLAHLDPFGSVLLPLLLFVLTRGQGPIIGYAKPVPINPLYFKDYKKDTIKVSLAGPLVNFLLGVTFALIFRFFGQFSKLSQFFFLISFYNFALSFFNLLPFPPLDGSHIFLNLLPERFKALKLFFLQYGLFLLIIFISFFSFVVFDLAQIAFQFFATF